MNHYNLSRDYALLLRLMQTQTVLCFVDYRGQGGDILRDAAKTNASHGNLRIQARGIEYVGAMTDDGFIRQCGEQHVEFVAPQEPKAELPLVAISYKLPWSHFDPPSPHMFAEIVATKFDSEGNPTAWAIREGHNVLAKDLEWELEPNPSRRDEDFFSRARYSTADEAYSYAKKWAVGHWIKIERPEA